MSETRSTLQVSRDVSLIFLIVGGANWGITAARMMAEKPFVWIPDLVSFLVSDRDTVYNLQMLIYFLVAVSAAFYTLSYALVRCFPQIAA